MNTDSNISLKVYIETQLSGIYELCTTEYIISSKCSRNSEAFASELLEHLEDICLRYLLLNQVHRIALSTLSRRNSHPSVKGKIQTKI